MFASGVCLHPQFILLWNVSCLHEHISCIYPKPLMLYAVRSVHVESCFCRIRVIDWAPFLFAGEVRYIDRSTHTHTHTCTKLSWLSQFLSHWIYRFGTIICIAWIRWGDTTINANCSVSSRASYVWRFAVSQILLELNSIYIRYSDDWSNHISFVQPSG